MIDENKLIENLKKEWEEILDCSENVETVLEYLIKFIEGHPKTGILAIHDDGCFPAPELPGNTKITANHANLRPCIVKIVGEAEVVSDVWGNRTVKMVSESQVFEGYFHRWGDGVIAHGNYCKIETYGIVEAKDGTVHQVPPECITFKYLPV